MVISLYQPLSFCQLGKRPNQEDYRLPDSNRPSERQLFFIVCDGVGGEDDGEVASKNVCEGFHEALDDTDWSLPFTIEDFQIALSKAYDRLDNAARKIRNYDMATTLAFISFHGDGCLIAHIGDSRIYQIRPSLGIIYRSSDHTQVNNLIHAGIMSPDTSNATSERSIINRYMEPSDKTTKRCMATVLQTSDIQADDYFFLCTDGVWECVNDEKLCSIFCSQDNDEDKCRQIATLCEDSKDNNTAYLLHIASVNCKKESSKQQEAEGSITDQYTEHLTLASRQHRNKTIDLEADEPETSLSNDIINFIKNLFQ